ncbi:hypothetical protein MRX96_027812 [Rhipicephalus microplus]
MRSFALGAKPKRAPIPAPGKSRVRFPGPALLPRRANVADELAAPRGWDAPVLLRLWANEEERQTRPVFVTKEEKSKAGLTNGPASVYPVDQEMDRSRA